MIWQALMLNIKIVSLYLITDDEEGQGLAEYALLLALVAVTMIALMAIFGPAVGNIFSNIVSHIDGVG